LENEEWFDQLVKTSLEDVPDHLHQLQARKREQKIMMILSENSESGISHSELAGLVKIDRKNLRRYMKRLIDRGLIRRGKGKQGKYYPSNKEHRGTIMYADILGKGATGLVLANEDIPLDSPFFKNIEIDDSLESVLYKFSNKVGSIIIYLLIQAMNPSNKILDNAKNSKEKDLDIEWWIDDAMSFLHHSLLPIFQDLLSSSLAYFKSFQDDYKKRGSFDKIGLYYLSMYRTPIYILDQTLISDLIDAFSKIYPSITEKLEWIRSQVPKLVAKQVSELENKQRRLDQQKKCKHIFESPSDKALLSKGVNNFVQCRKCLKIKVLYTKV
jgi:predicted transcriptional regulator